MIEKFTIDRTKWINGTGNGVLLNESGCGCALGHYCLASGVAPEALIGKTHISSCMNDKGAVFDYNLIHERLRPTVNGNPSVKSTFIANDNDDDIFTQEVREKELIAGFEQLGIWLVFVN